MIEHLSVFSINYMLKKQDPKEENFRHFFSSSFYSILGISLNVVLHLKV
jgi:hypothetical protein